MAYSSRRRTSRRSTTSSRSYSPRRRVTRARTSTRRSSRSTSKAGQTLKIVIEQVPASQVSRPEGALQMQAAAPKKSKF